MRRVGIALLLLALAPHSAHAGSVGSTILGLFPRNVGQVAYLDVREARRHAWFEPLREQMLPTRFRQFVRFLGSIGVGLDSQVHDLVWAAIPADRTTPEQVVGLALGEFSPEQVQTQCRQLHLPQKTLRGYTLYAFGSGASPYDVFFFFLDSNTAVFGQSRALESLLAVRFGEAESLLRNPELAGLVEQLDGQATFWAALGRFYAQLGVRQFLPELGEFGQAAPLLQRIRGMLITVDAGSGVQAQFEGILPGPDDANLLAALLEAGLLYRRYQAGGAAQGLPALLDQAQVIPRGDRLDVRLQVSDQQLNELIRQRVFAVSM
jgi:hypothetical protein